MPKGQERDLILIVEDDQEVSDMLCTYLRTKRYRLATTPMGGDVLVLCQVERPNLILLDINLPDIDGYEIARRIRASKNSTLAHIPIIAVTANAMKGDAQKAIQAGCSKYMSKPINIVELVEMVDVFVRKGTERGTA